MKTRPIRVPRLKSDRRSPFAPVPVPVPVRRGGWRRAPLETRVNFDPWLPANDAYPEVRTPLRMLASILLVLLISMYALTLVAMFHA